MRAILLFLLPVLIFSSCTGGSSSGTACAEEDVIQGNSFTRYASGFRLFDHGSYKMLQVLDPWQKSHDVIFDYLLAPDRKMIPDSLAHLPFIKIPVERVITLSTTHVAMIEKLGKEASIVGLSGSDFIYSENIRKDLESGKVLDVGYGQGLDYETMVKLNPDLVFLYGVEGNVMTSLEKLNELGIPAVFCGEYLETHPLGKAEWIRFFSLFFNLEAESATIFDHIDSVYNDLANLTEDIKNKPLVLNGLPWKDTWYMAGGRSFAAKLIEDAGGAYLWNHNTSTQALPLDLESVYLRAVNADIWINPGAAKDLEGITQLDQRLADLAVIKNAHVYNNNARISTGGGNDYWESGTVRPDLVLADLIQVFHPDLLPDHHFVYYRQLK